MTHAPALHLLDEIRHCEHDPRLFAENLAALSRHSPDLAKQLERVAIPSEWRPARGLDGWPLFRTERPGEPPQYSGGSAAPATRAAAVLAGVPASDRNVALPAVLAGAELFLLLRRHPAHAAVFVFESDPPALAAVLRTQDLRVAIEARRLILSHPKEPLPLLDALLTREEGLLPPATLLRLPGVPEQRVTELQALCESLNRRCAERRSAAVISAAPRASTRTDIALLSLSSLSAAHRAADELADAARALGRTVLLRALRTPTDAHPLSHERALAEHRPHCVIAFEHAAPPFRSGVAAAPPVAPNRGTATPTQDPRSAGPSSQNAPDSCTRFEWRCLPPMSSAEAGELSNGGTEILAASPLVEAAWRAAGRRVRPFYWAVRAAEIDQPPVDRSRGAACVLLVGDVPDDSESAAGVVHPTHRILWRELQRRARETAFKRHASGPAALLDGVERASGLRIGDADTRAALLRAIVERIIPAAIAHRLIDLCVDAGASCVGLGTGWQRIGVAALRADHPQRVHALAALAIGAPDPLTPDLLRVAAWGIPVAMPWCAARSDGELGGVLLPGTHFLPLASADAATRYLRDSQQRRECPIALSAREHLRQHTASQRMRALLDSCA
ncbi:MAG: glycosyltransferase family 1 protein [Phycisphaerales bacterium]|nr:glycosyltransferase family 1 protein [Phycisphaerales bacterium]